MLTIYIHTQSAKSRQTDKQTDKHKLGTFSRLDGMGMAGSCLLLTLPKTGVVPKELLLPRLWWSSWTEAAISFSVKDDIVEDKL